MDAWSSIVMVVNILLLVAGWLLFQQAKSDLTARAAQIPVLSEVKALQRSIAKLLEQLKLESAQASAQLEARCLEARDLLAALDRRLEERRDAKPAGRGSRRRSSLPEQPEAKAADSASRHEGVCALADEGLDSSVIAQQTGYSTGEVELILDLRNTSA